MIAYGLTVGTLSRITIENLDSQAHDVRESKAAAFVGAGAGRRRRSTAGATTAAWRAAEPASAARRSGSSSWRRPTAWPRSSPTPPRRSGSTARSGSSSGGQSANPSTGELLEAVEATDADELLILPNNPNVVLAARQVASMTERTIHVVPTRNCAEGVAALFELDPSQDAEANAAAMTAAGRAIQTMQVTEAVRDATVSGRKVKKGQTIVLDPDDGLLAVDNDPQKAVWRRSAASSRASAC